MQSGISRLAAVIGARGGSGDGGLFFAKVTAALALDDGCGMVVPKDDYIICLQPGSSVTLSSGMNVLCAWVDGQVVIIGAV